MKLKTFICFLMLSSILIAHEYQNNLGDIHSRFILHRGEEQFRTNIVAQELELAGQSNSNQYIEYIGKAYGENGDDADYTKTKSFLLGTNSNLVKHPNVFAGISLGHMKSTLKMDDTHNLIRSYGFDYLIGYKKENTVFIGKLGYTETKNNLFNHKYRTKNYGVGGEIGYNYFVDTTTVLYPFAGINYTQYTVKGHKGISTNNQDIFSGLVGLNMIKIFNDKFMITAGIDWNMNFKNRKYPITDSIMKTIEKNYGQFHINAGYFIDPDFLFTVGYRNLFNKDYNYKVISVGLSHYF